MKIAWASNAPHVPTGYGQQTAQMLPRLRKAGHDVAVIANFGVSGAPMEYEGVKVYPTGKTAYSTDIMAAHAKHFFHGDQGWLIVLFDAWTLRNAAFKDMNVAVWTPIDHYPTPPLVKTHFTEHDSVPIAMSEFGQLELAKSGLDPMYAPHGIDTTIFRPLPGARERAGLPDDKLIVGMVSNNKGRAPSRKAFYESFQAFAMFHRDHPDSLLYVHSEKEGADEGIDLEVLATACGIPPEALIFTDQYRYRAGMIEPAQMAELYNAFDVLLFCSKGEGFGIPVIEAQACGTPVIVSKFSAQEELVHPAGGYQIGGQFDWDDLQKALWFTPFIDQIVEALERVHAQRDILGDVAKPLRDWAMQWDADVVFDRYWKPILADLEGRLPDTQPISAVPLS